MPTPKYKSKYPGIEKEAATHPPSPAINTRVDYDSYGALRSSQDAGREDKDATIDKVRANGLQPVPEHTRGSSGSPLGVPNPIPKMHNGGPITVSGVYRLKAGEHVLTEAETKKAHKHALVAAGVPSMAKNINLSGMRAPAMAGKSKDIATTKPTTGKKSIVKIVSRKK